METKQDPKLSDERNWSFPYDIPSLKYQSRSY